MATRQKEIERWFLEAARKADSIIPDGTIEDFEKPDFKIHTANGLLGIEVTELLRSGSGPIRPVKQESLHKNIIEVARTEYYSNPNAIPVQVRAYFWNPDGERLAKRKMARALAEFVRTHAVEANPVATFSRLDGVPEGFDVISIAAGNDRWYSGECGGSTVAETFEQLALFSPGLFGH